MKVKCTLMSLPDDDILSNHIADILPIQYNYVQLIIFKYELSFLTFVCLEKKNRKQGDLAVQENKSKHTRG